jgi:hypothetical protein
MYDPMPDNDTKPEGRNNIGQLRRKLQRTATDEENSLAS